MENIYHIHEVLERIFAMNKAYTIESLYKELAADFGDNAQFANCASNTFPIAEVVPFLLGKGKISLQGDKIIPLTPACSH
ncbi:MAG: DUF2492 family protein [Cyclobacteriaceae bacterium]|nr:DUF2492 family protein [Cyclobacteriaceae bacterium]